MSTHSRNSESFHSAESCSSRSSNPREPWSTVGNENVFPALWETNEHSSELSTALTSSPLTNITKNSFPPKNKVRIEAL